jgi:hypothetical protein
MNNNKNDRYAIFLSRIAAAETAIAPARPFPALECWMIAIGFNHKHLIMNLKLSGRSA